MRRLIKNKMKSITEETPERQAEIRAQWRKNTRKWCRAHRDQFREVQRRYRENPKAQALEKKWSKTSYQNNREARIQKQKEWYAKNGDRVRAHLKHSRATNPIRHMLWSAKAMAKKNGLPFSLKASDLTMPECCPALGIAFGVGSRDNSDSSPSIDRIIPSLGYVPGNVCVISRRANRIKTDATLEEIRAVVRYLETR